MKEISDELYSRLNKLGIIPNDVRSGNKGNSDYAQHFLQPWSIIQEYGLNYWDGDIIKRVLRTKKGDSRKMDYEKIIHICQERIRQIECEEKSDTVEDDCIIKGDKFRCIKTWEIMINPHGLVDFEDGVEYQSQCNGSITNNFGLLVPVSDWKEHFIRLKD